MPVRQRGDLCSTHLLFHVCLIISISVFTRGSNCDCGIISAATSHDIRATTKISGYRLIKDSSFTLPSWLEVRGRCLIFGNDHFSHDDVIKWKHIPRYWPFVQGIHRSPVNSLHKGQWRGPLVFSLICVWINGWVNNRDASDLRRYRAHYDVTVIPYPSWL